MLTGIIDSGQKIVTNGLVFHLDAAQLRSYPGSGTTWSDISGNGYNGTLTNGPTFDSGNGGSIVFDGTNDYSISQNTNLNLSTNSNFTYFLWFYPNFNSNLNSGRALLNFTGAGPVFSRSYLRWENTSLGFYLDIADNTGGSAWYTNPKPTFSSNTWNCLSFTHSSVNNGIFYFNGQAISTSNGGVKATTVVNNPITVGYGSVNNYYHNGRISNVLIYTNNLTSTEIQQNYNATKSRFGL